LSSRQALVVKTSLMTLFVRLTRMCVFFYFDEYGSIRGLRIASKALNDIYYAHRGISYRNL